ncbi:MAG TPA: SPW repeat protein, partial [Thermomicrobiaceae bacterium]|nr:SPW repeat protein [Thermomicrobiaceae bacterium]
AQTTHDAAAVKETLSTAGQSVTWDLITALGIPAGIWAIASPYMLHFELYHGVRVSNDFFGSMIILLFITHLTVPVRFRWVGIPALIFGIWILVSPFVLGMTADTTGLINDIILGAVIAILAATRFVRQDV